MGDRQKLVEKMVLAVGKGRFCTGAHRAVTARALGDQAIADAIYVAMLFCMYNRIVDALGCEVMSPKQLQGGPGCS